MIERTVVAQKMKEFEIQEFVEEHLKRVGHSKTTLQRTPLGEKVVVHASRPGLVVGRQGESIKRLTKRLKEDFGLENPQVEVNEIKDIYLDANIVAEMIASSLERFGTKRFKATMHRSLQNVMAAGAMGAEIVMSGKLPSKRARTWRVYRGHLKKSGDVKVEGVKTAYTTAELKSGSVGVQVRIMPPDLKLPDRVVFKSEMKPAEKARAPEGTPAAAAEEIETIEAAEETVKGEKPETKEEKPKPAAKKAPAKKEEKPKPTEKAVEKKAEAPKNEEKPAEKKAEEPKKEESQSPEAPKAAEEPAKEGGDGKTS